MTNWLSGKTGDIQEETEKNLKKGEFK